MPKKRDPIARDLRSPKYRKRVVADKKRKADREAARKPVKDSETIPEE